MSISIDDLVSSFSSSHIGQEALDLAALQSQLNQTLFSPYSSTDRAKQVPQMCTMTCNTPITCTPSTSAFHFGQMAGSSASTAMSMGPMDDAEDEQMVEDLLVPSSPVTAETSFTPSFSSSFSSSFATPQRPISPPPSHPTSNSVSSDSSTSVFTSTDPFYLAALQKEQESYQSKSMLAQSVRRLSQGSSFFKQDSPMQRPHPHWESFAHQQHFFASTAF